MRSIFSGPPWLDREGLATYIPSRSRKYEARCDPPCDGQVESEIMGVEAIKGPKPGEDWGFKGIGIVRSLE